MEVLVSDSSILIELSKWNLLESMFCLPFKFVMPDVLFNEELIDLGRIQKSDLLDLGLIVEALDFIGVSKALQYQERKKSLSIPDCFALSLAFMNKFSLLTSDNTMRKLAIEESIEVHGILWVLDKLLEYNVISEKIFIYTLKKMAESPRSFIPSNEIKKRLDYMNNKETINV